MDQEKDHQIVEKAVTLSLIEVFLGSLLHVLRVPFTGHFLSLNQGLFLGRFHQGISNRFECAKVIIEISMVVSIMKALAPAGKKLGPMISISMQGFLYALGTVLFGTQLIGQMISMIFLSLWAFVQPLVTFFIMYGSDLVSAVDYLASKMPYNLFYTALVALILVKAILAALVPVFCRRADWFNRYEKMITKTLYSPKKIKARSAVEGALKDLLRPGVLLSFIFMGAFFVFHQEEGALILWKILRAIAMAFTLFYLARSPWFSQVLFNLCKRQPFLKRVYERASKASVLVREKLG